MMVLKVLASSKFSRTVKKLHLNEKKIVDRAVSEIVKNPAIGEEKKGDLAGVFVYKFKIRNQEVLLAYRLQPGKIKPKEVMLLTLGTHENFYADLKR